MAMTRPMLALGLMSGTSCDGVDAALLTTDGLSHVVPGPAFSHPYAKDFRSRLRSVLGGKGPLEAVAEELTRVHAKAVGDLLRQAGIAPAAVRVLGFHGQSVLHEPEKGRTWQIGDGRLLARLTGIDTVSDFRSADVAAGGQGAPFVPLYHQALATGLPERPLAVLNLGGVGNVTWIGKEADELIAFDTGPANALVDDWALRHTGRPVDQDGRLALSGHVDGSALAALMRHPYFARPAPKSLDRDAFGMAPVAGLSAADGAATLVAFTAAAVARGREILPAPPRRWLVTGGGRRNPAVMAALEKALGQKVEPVESVGWDGDVLEAQAFAYLAVRSLADLPLSLPSTTGVARPTCGGRLDRAA
ncbi:MAG TPA: anhydro-N-acetylmuramic acid kinase [Dongiaceae bacterium]|nr:anhydro-N-acetylmuramic acid kinase [Dongiaceae bacterium]